MSAVDQLDVCLDVRELGHGSDRFLLLMSLGQASGEEVEGGQNKLGQLRKSQDVAL